MGSTIFVRGAASRIGGYTLNNFWVLCMFFNTIMFNASANPRPPLYLCFIISLAALAATLTLFPHAVKRPDRRVLSKPFSIGSGLAMALSTILLAFADMASAAGMALLVASGILSGIASGILFLGWMRLFTDLGTTVALVDSLLSWLFAALLDCLFTHLPIATEAVVAIVAIAGLGSAFLLRRGTFHQRQRPAAITHHEITRRTRTVFIKGRIACASMAAIAGFSDVLAGGFRYTAVPDFYETRLAFGFVGVCILLLVLEIAAKFSIRALRKSVTLLFAVGCLLTPFIVQLSSLSDVILSAAYQAGLVTLVACVCIDVSNYYDIPATKVAGTAFAGFYIAQIAGNCVAQALVFTEGLTINDISAVALAMALLLIVISLSVFTDGDMVEAAVGTMLQNEQDEGTDGPNGKTAGPDDAAALPGPDGIERAAQRLAAQHQLTPRETEILPYLLRGRSLPRIQEELCISKGTANTHLRHIYQKMGVHTRQELLDAINREETGYGRR